MRKLLTLVLVLSASFAFADSKSVEKKLEKADAAFQRHDIDRAEKLLRDAIKEDPDSLEAHRMLADLLSYAHSYQAASGEYETVLKLNEGQKKLNDTERRQMIDQEGVTTALSGDLKKAQQIYLEAIKQDPDYSMFNYNLACVYAELGDLDTALPYLKKAWDNRDNVPPGTKFPDPRQDSSFRKYLNDSRFQEAVQNMVL